MEKETGFWIKHKWSLFGCAILSGILILIFWQIFVVRDQQRQLEIEQARLDGLTRAHSDMIKSHETKIINSENRILVTETQITEINQIAATHTEQILISQGRMDEMEKDIKATKAQIRHLRDNPATTVVVAATDEAAKQEAFNNWAANHPDWKARRSCMRSKMNDNSNISLNEAYNACG